MSNNTHDDALDESKLLRETAPLINEIKQFLSLNHVKHALALGTELFTAASPFLDKPTWWNAAKSCFGMGKVLVEDVEVYSDDYFAGDEWVEPYSSDFNPTLINVLKKFPYERIKTSDETVQIIVAQLPNGLKVGWTIVGKSLLVDHVYVETARAEEARLLIKQLLWDQFKNKSLVMRKNNAIIVTGDDSRVIFEIDDAFETKLSKRAQDYSEYLKKPIQAGVPRSVLLYGPPGTGKSTLARTIIELMNLRSFRIRIGDLGSLDNSTLFEAINIFEPDAVILDDFDRCNGQAQLLETLEFFQQSVKLVIVTVNDKQRLDDALLRPGRIDELLLIDKMDEEVVRHVLGKYADGFELVKDWPIAFIAEYVVRRTYLPAAEAANSLIELTKRVKDLDSYRDIDDVSRMTTLLQRQGIPKEIARAQARAMQIPKAKFRSLHDVDIIDSAPPVIDDTVVVTPDEEEVQRALAQRKSLCEPVVGIEHNFDWDDDEDDEDDD